MEALKEFDIKELLRRQVMLDNKFDEKETIRKRASDRIIVAYFAELGELIQELKNDWNYWKNSTKEIDREKVLEELSDCLHFFLSYINSGSSKIYDEKYIYFFRDNIDSLESAIIQLSKMYFYPISQIFGAMLKIAEHAGATEEEFLKAHHKVWLRNTGERTKEEY